MIQEAALAKLITEIRGCTVCAEHLPLGPRPILAAGAMARVAIVGQAPGTRVHESGVPWDDDSGDHLRSWLDIDRDTFLDAGNFAIIPMGFCYPGKKKGGDAPPRPECAPLWHERLFAHLPRLSLTLLVGQYAQAFYLDRRRRKTLTETVRAFDEYLPDFFPLPHPSWRSRIWVKKNPWFESDALPVLRERVSALVPQRRLVFRRPRRHEVEVD
jgi:uracil-DNA glycosylase